MPKSIEPIVKSWGDRQIERLGWTKIGPEQISVDEQIDKSLKNNPSKTGGDGGGRPDYTIMLDNGDKIIPVFVEYKGIKGKLISQTKNGFLMLKDDNGNFEYEKIISKYAVNGAAYYAGNVVKDTEYKEVLCVGINGYLSSDNKENFEVIAYLVNDSDSEIPLFFGNYSDLSFLNKKEQIELFQKIEDIQADPEEVHKKALLDDEKLDKMLKDLNQHLRDETKIRVGQRIFIVAASIMAALGVQNSDGEYVVSPLRPDQLQGSKENGTTDGDQILNKASNFLKEKNIPDIKQDQIINSLKQTLIYSNLQEKNLKTGLSPLKSAYQEVYVNVIPAFKTTGTIDFTGKLFNVMNDWVDVPDGDTNDVVLTPRYITDLMARLTNVDMNSYVWDWALGSGGFLISSMNIMLKDARSRLNSPDEIIKKHLHIKKNQLLGIEKLPDIYILAVLNMILMGDGSTNILNEDSLREFDGTYSYGEEKNKNFPANVFLLNPPYSAEGNGMIFVERALEKMNGGTAAVIIQDSAGSGKATEINQRILKNNRLVASIKMPTDLFKASVQTSIYLFEVNSKHQKNDLVKFIDFREDGYKRTNRRKSSKNLQDTGTARDRYKELIKIVRNGAEGAKFYKKDKYYFEGAIDPLSGNDWNLERHQKWNIVPNENDFKRVVGSYLSWELKQLLKVDENDDTI